MAEVAQWVVLGALVAAQGWHLWRAWRAWRSRRLRIEVGLSADGSPTARVVRDQGCGG